MKNLSFEVPSALIESSIVYSKQALIDLVKLYGRFNVENKPEVPFTFQLNGEVMSERELIDRVYKHMAREFEAHVEVGAENEYCRFCVESFMVYEVEVVEKNYGGAASDLEVQYSVPGVEEKDCKRFQFKEIVKVGIEMGLIVDYTDDSFTELEVVVDLENDGYFSAYHGMWIDVPNSRKRINYNGWLANLEYDVRERLAERLVERICIR